MKVKHSMSCDSGSGPLIVVGMWRSGTSLLYSLLNQHPQIALMYEADLFLLQPLFSSKGSNPDWRARWEFWNSVFSRHQIQAERIPIEVRDLRGGAMAAWKEYAAGSAVMGEKSPNYYDCLPVLAEQFPGARFLIIWRDLNDICRSIVKARSGSTFFSKPGILHRAIIGCGKLKRGRDALLSQNIPVHEIQYEEMVQNPAEVMAAVCSFLGIPFDARMTTLQGFDSSSIYEGSHHKQVKGGKILRFKHSGEVLSAGVRRKIRRYVTYWRKESGGAWPRYPNRQGDISDVQVSDVPSSIERFGDELLFRTLRMLDGFTALVYCYAPFGWLEKYRSFKKRRFTSEVAKVDAVQTGTLQVGVVQADTFESDKVESGAVHEEASQHVV
jgi:hypothetical protein